MKYAKVLLRAGISLLFLWFGMNQLLQPDVWIQWVPPFLFEYAKEAVIVNGFLETILGFLLLIGLRIRIVATVLAIHLLGITFTLGYNDIAVRDFVLSIATLSVALNGEDKYTFGKLLERV